MADRFIISSKEPLLISEYINNLRDKNPGYGYQMCGDFDSFSEIYHRGGIFDSEPIILCLWELTADLVKQLLPLISSPTEDILVFIQRKILPRNKAYTYFRAECQPVELNPLNLKECVRWTRSQMRKSGLSYDSKVAEMLVEKKSADMYGILSEIRKLQIVYGDRQVTGSAVRYISDSSEARVFSFIEHYFHKRLKKALYEFDKFSEDYYVKLIHMVIKHIEKLYKIAEHRSQGKSPEDVSDIMGLNKFILKTKYYTVLSIFNKTRLLKMIDLFNELDYMLRLSPLPKKLLFESYLLKSYGQ